MLTLTVYQAQIVPQQNAQTEFQHFEDVRNELIELRNAVSTAGQADVSQFPSVTLGTTYRTRTLTINPPDPAGTLKTSDQSHNITISNGTPKHNLNISTRFLEYQPGYNEISIGSMWYEHSVLYLDERDRGNNVSIIQEQNIVKDGEVTITALQNQFQETNTGRVTLELYPREKVNMSAFPNGNGTNLTVKVPTRLSEDEYWNKTLNYSGGIYNGVDSDRLNLSVNETDLEVNTVGIRGEPDEGSAKNVDPQENQNNNNNDGTSNDNSADSTSGVDGSISQSNIAGGGREITFDIEVDGEVTLIDFNVLTQNDMSSRPFSDSGSDFSGFEQSDLPQSFTGTVNVGLRDFGGSGNIAVGNSFVNPNSADADVIVTLFFDDGSESRLGIPVN